MIAQSVTTETLFNKNYRQAERLVLLILWCLFVMSLGLSGMHDALNCALLVGLP